MPRRTNTNNKSSKTRSRKSRSRTKSRINSKNKNSYKSKRTKSRKYRGGCKTCENSPPGTWKSTGPMYGGSNPYQISKDIYSHVTNSTPYSVA